MHYTFRLPLAFLFVLTLLLFTGCKDDDEKEPKPVDEEELITTVVLTFTELDGEGSLVGEPLIFQWKDEDGATGSSAPEIDNIVLEQNKQYQLTVKLLNESVSPAEDVTEEIEEEKETHQFFYVLDNAVARVLYDDEEPDANGKPVGLRNRFDALDEGEGTLTVILRHEPDKEAAFVSEGSIDNAGGSTDVEAEFPLVIND